ncbi:MAG: hypothetical protein KF785_09465 [Gemmatimonadales bacterium]|nr:hypothetical protein [Gemmatimonadales bacterium]
MQRSFTGISLFVLAYYARFATGQTSCSLCKNECVYWEKTNHSTAGFDEQRLPFRYDLHSVREFADNLPRSIHSASGRQVYQMLQALSFRMVS